MNEVDTQSVSMGIKEIQGVIPHRYPFLLVDRVLELNMENNTIVALKNVSGNESFFQGHFPGHPIMPGVLILEALAQTGAILFHKRVGPGKIALFLNVKNAKFRKSVHPGDSLMLHAEGLHFGSTGGRLKGVAKVGEAIACQAEIGFAIVDEAQV